MRRRGVELRLVIQDAHTPRPKVDLALLKAVGRARRWFDQVASGRTPSLATIASQAGISVRYVGRLMRLAFLAPQIVEMIVQGSQPADLTIERLTRRILLPLKWEAQKSMLGMP